MAENISMIVLGLLIVLLGITNLKGNISSIHWYNRTRITEETKPKYAKLMGISALIMGIALTLTGILLFFVESQLVHFIGVLGCIAGVIIMLYAQFKYNKGIF